jgi:hypothetical protein
MSNDRFARLAEELAAGDPEVPVRLESIRGPVERLRQAAAHAVDAFVARAQELGASHLAHVDVSEVLPDEKHVDCLSFRVRRGRFELLCIAVAGASPKIRTVGPFRRGKTEGPCADYDLAAPQIEGELADRIEELLREAAGA